MSIELTKYQIDEVLKTVLLFDATLTSSVEIKDVEIKHLLKQRFNTWFNQGRNLRKNLLEIVKENKEMEHSFEEMSAYLYQVCTLALQSQDYNETIETLKAEIEIQNNFEN